MGQPRNLVCDQDIDRSFDQIAAILRARPFDLLQRATTSAAARATSMSAGLRVEIAGFEVGVSVRLLIRRVREELTPAGIEPSLLVELSWDAISKPSLFPSMLAELRVSPLSANQTHLEIRGTYWTPMGPLGVALDAAIGHRIAEASVNHF